ncbi:MAG: hypothetical protein J6W11_04565 [Alphaproteobacteria bacterium]|nr:hypothetical protein [Alphaproteobacteria bacterium]
MEKQAKRNILCLTLCVLVGMLTGMLFKNEVLWDFSHYHYYNAFAFLNDRAGLDVVPASVNTFYNPIIELPLYLYIKYFNDFPNILYALQGMWFGLFLFVLYKICRLFFEGAHKYLFSFLVLVVCTTGQATFGQIGTSANEIPVAFFILWGLYLLLKTVKDSETQNLKRFFLCGLIMGIGLGLKQTVVVYCVASGLTLIICWHYLKQPVKSIFFFALGGLAGYLIVNGYFMYKYWVLYSNPFFPFLNGMFHSPYFFDFNYKNDACVPSLTEFFIFPFLWHLKTYVVAGLERPYYNLPLTLYYVLPIVAFCVLACKKKLGAVYKQQRLQTMAYIFVFLSILIWMGLFGVGRYTVVIEAVGAIVLIDLFNYYHRKQHPIIFILHCIFILYFICCVCLPYGHVQKHIEMQEVRLPEDTLVKLYGMPTAFVIPLMAKEQSFKTVTYYPKCTLKNLPCINGKGSDFAEYGAFAEQRKKIEKEHKGPIVYIYDKDNLNIFQTKGQVQQEYEQNLKLCQRALHLGWIKDMNECLKEPLKKYLKNIEIAEIYVSYDDIVFNYACQELKNNLNPNLYICVPKDMQNKILGENDDK